MEKNITNISAAPGSGLMLKNHIHKNSLRRAALERLMGKNDYREFGCQQLKSMRTDTVWRLCNSLKHNFLQYLAAQLPPEFTTNAPNPTLPFQERIAQLEAENKQVNTKVETLMAVVRSG